MKQLSFLILSLITLSCNGPKGITINPSVIHTSTEFSLDQDTLDLYATRTGSPTDFLKLELVTKSFFDSIVSKKSIHPILTDKFVRKNDTTFSVLLANDSSKVFADVRCDCDATREYSYKGHIDFLNAFVIDGAFWEEYNYELYSGIDGKMMLISGGGEFNISPNKKHICSLSPAVYQDITEFVFTTIEADKTLNEPQFFEFTNWLVAGKVKWISETIFIVAVLTEPFRDIQGGLSNDFHYMKITIR